MASQIGRDLGRILADVEMLGCFSPFSFHISVGTEGVNDLSALPGEHKATLAHEFGHLLHYCTSYFGLTNILPWARTINILRSLPPDITEQALTEAAGKVLGYAREQQVYSIDDEYYFEPDVELYPAARAARGRWSVRETTGGLLTIDGKLSDRRFWATRFFLGEGAKNLSSKLSFLRIPLGMRTVLEHMAKSIDFMGEMVTTDPSDLSYYYDEQASEPDLLHYFCLTHWIGPEMERKYGRPSVPKSYFVAGQLVSVLTEIPFDAPEIWTALKTYAGRHRTDLVPHMSHPHPSFIFPIIRDAAFKSNIDYNNYDLDRIEARANNLLKAIDLPTLLELRKYTDKLRLRVCETLNQTDVGTALSVLLKWLNNYEVGLGWKNRLANPTRDLGKIAPVPVTFQDDTYLDGTVLRWSNAMALSKFAHRRSEILRFPFTRDIVSQGNASLSGSRHSPNSFYRSK